MENLKHLLTHSDISVADKEGDGVFYLDIEDFLIGILELSSELVNKFNKNYLKKLLLG